MNYKIIKNKIIKFIKDYLKKAKANGVVLGISGGIDSSVIAKLSVEALGENNVLGLVMPCESQKKDIQDAEFLSRHLNINYKIIDLTNIYKSLIKTLNIKDKSKKIKTHTIYSNLKARLRMLILYFEAAKNNFLVIGTTNKSEFITGYYTKYGDGGVDIEPIGDLLKKEVLELAKYLNIPDFLIKNIPKAGFVEGLNDEDELGFSYFDLDKYIEKGFGNKKNINKIEELYRKNKHKRFPPKILNLKRKFFLK